MKKGLLLIGTVIFSLIILLLAVGMTNIGITESSPILTIFGIAFIILAIWLCFDYRRASKAENIGCMTAVIKAIIIFAALMIVSAVFLPKADDIEQADGTESMTSAETGALIESVVTTAEAESSEAETSTEEQTAAESASDFTIDTTEIANNKWRMTYSGTKVTDKLDVFTSAAEGTEFVVVFFDIENLSEENQNFSMFFTDFYVDNVKTAQTLYGLSIDKAMPLTALPIDAGRKAKGYFLFQLEPTWQNIEIIYNDDALKRDNENVIRFNLSK